MLVSNAKRLFPREIGAIRREATLSIIAQLSWRGKRRYKRKPGFPRGCFLALS